MAIVEIADTLNRSPKSVSQHVWVMKLKDIKEQSRRAVPVEVYYDIGWVERAKPADGGMVKHDCIHQ